MAKVSAPQAGVAQCSGNSNSQQFQPPFPHPFNQCQGQFQPPLPTLPGQEADAQADFQPFDNFNFQGVAGNFDLNLPSPLAVGKTSMSKRRKPVPEDEDQRPDSLRAFRQSKHLHRQNLHNMPKAKKVATKGS